MREVKRIRHEYNIPNEGFPVNSNFDGYPISGTSLQRLYLEIVKTFGSTLYSYLLSILQYIVYDTFTKDVVDIAVIKDFDETVNIKLVRPISKKRLIKWIEENYYQIDNQFNRDLHKFEKGTRFGNIEFRICLSGFYRQNNGNIAKSLDDISKYYDNDKNLYQIGNSTFSFPASHHDADEMRKLCKETLKLADMLYPEYIQES